MSDTQTLEKIDLVYKSKPAPAAIRNGNNAAWMCWCGSGEPLLGAGLPGLRDQLVECPDCKSQYRVDFGKEGDTKNKPIKVVEVE